MARGKSITTEEINNVLDKTETSPVTINRVRNKLYRVANNVPGNHSKEDIAVAQELFSEFRKVYKVRNRSVKFKPQDTVEPVTETEVKAEND